MQRSQLLVKRLSENATLPVCSSSLAAGLDLSSAIDTVVPAHGKALVTTDLSMAIPLGCYGRVAPRSGLAWKKFIDVGAGVIDADYRGNIGVVLFNHSDEDLEVKCGDRIAQLILEKIATPYVVEVEELETTERGAGGFGSTGVAKRVRPDCEEKSDPEHPHNESELEENIVPFAYALELIAYYSLEGLISQDQKMQLKRQLFAGDQRILAVCAANKTISNLQETRENLLLLLG